MPRRQPGDALIEFAAKLIGLVHEASATTSYKYALLLALIEICQERFGQGLGARGSVTTRQLAEKVTELYWTHTRQHDALGAAPKQITGRGRSIVDLIACFGAEVGEKQSTTPGRGRRAAPDQYEDLIDNIEWILIRYPIPLLQPRSLELLYPPEWEEQPPSAPVTKYQKARRTKEDEGSFASTIQFHDGVEEYLARLAPLFRPLIQREWALFVARCNRELTEDHLHSFLFERLRTDLARARAPLLRLQSGKCFYCQQPIGGTAQLDHFIPWSRCPSNDLGNLLATDRTCNNSKRDHLAAAGHLRDWRARLDAHESGELAAIANRLDWDFEPGRALRLARSVYSASPEGTPLWQRDGALPELRWGPVLEILA